MNDLELGWLVPTLLQVTGLAMGLGILGFIYEGAMREKKSIMEELEAGMRARWLAAGGVLFAIGMLFTRAGWISKVAAVVLAGVLVGLAWMVPGLVKVEVDRSVYRAGRKKSVGKWIAGVLAVLIVGAILAWGIHLGYHTIQLVGMAEDLQGDASQVQMDKGLALIDDAAAHISAIRLDTRPLVPIFNLLSGVPRAGVYLGQVDPLVEYADGLAQAGKEISLGLEPLLEEKDGQEALCERASQVLLAEQEHFTRAEQAIERASEVRGRIKPEVLPASARVMYMKLDERFEVLRAGVMLLQVGPQLLGAQGARNYLVLAQNRDELRATGGFISGIGLLTVEQGKNVQFGLEDSYAVDDFSKPYPQPPEALQRFMLADYWVTRDANWSPDFPTSARKAQELYTLSTGVETQGVVAFNQLAVKKVLEVIGPVQVAGTEEAVTAENVEEFMQQAWAPEPEEGLSQEWWQHRKDFMQQLGSVIIEKAMKTNDRVQLLNLAKTFLELMEQGQVLVYFNDEEAQEAIAVGGWDHALKTGDGDFLSVVDSNVGFNKVDAVVKRSITYKIDLSDINNPKSEVTLRYRHSGNGEGNCKQQISYGEGTYQDMVERCYLNYWRMYMPEGARLLTSNVQKVPGEQLLSGEEWTGQVEDLDEEGGVTGLAGLMMLAPGKSTELIIAYSQSPGIIQPAEANIVEYKLRIVPQAGLEQLPVRIEVTLPRYASLVATEDDWARMSEQTWVLEEILSGERELRLRFQATKT